MKDLDRCQRVVVQAELPGSDVLPQLRHGGRPDNGAGDTPARIHEGERKLGQAQPMRTRHLGIGLHGALHSGLCITRAKALEQGQATMRAGVLEIFAGQMAKGERRIGEQTHPLAKT
ncbi:hypothetical protein RZS08_62870, partial [Arthrospira platensis SPKY1]|nr:hypothetical protein [Arthrospira platensis SPKY1]